MFHLESETLGGCFPSTARTENACQYRLPLARSCRSVSRPTPSFTTDEGITNVGEGGGGRGPCSLINDGFVLASRHSDVTPSLASERTAASRCVPQRERAERSPGGGGGAASPGRPPREAECIKKLMSALGSSANLRRSLWQRVCLGMEKGVRLSREVNRRGQ